MGKKTFQDYSFDFKDEDASESEGEDILKVELPARPTPLNT